jgi:hypothetical protein
MASEEKEFKDGIDLPDELPKNPFQVMLEPLNHGLAVAERKALELGVPTHAVIEMLLNHLTSTIAMVDPNAREDVIKQVVRSIAPMTRRYVDSHNMTPGGIIKPEARV